MNEKANNLINRVINEKKLRGKDKNCHYFPCHDEIEDCSFCYCPFYPCNDTNMGEYKKKGTLCIETIWACSSCVFNHNKKNAEKILKALISSNCEFQQISKEKLQQIRKDILGQEGDQI
ncbi:MAG: hypothetical protein JXA99_09060 [Candidatus Lokiarchaeota archaeon]|nr:hypothetical protein [Candidatus Lokiarchaeota archaeon]